MRLDQLSYIFMLLIKNTFGKGQISIPIPAGYHETLVTPKASRGVEAIWSFAAQDAGKNLVLPDGRSDIIIRYNIYESALPIPIITGPATQAYNVIYKPGDSWLGVRMRPHRGVTLWQCRIRNAANEVIREGDALTLLPALAKIIRHGVSLADLAQVAETTWSTKEERYDQPLLRALDILHVAGGRLRIEALARFAGCSARHLNRLFKSNIGLSTKMYSQLVQFHRTLNLVQREGLSFAAAAFEGGYADQAHLTRAFRRFGGFTPSGIPCDLSIPALFT